MVYNSNAIISAILAVSTAAPILAAPLGSCVDPDFLSVSNRTPVPPLPTQPEAVPALALIPASAPEPEAVAKETLSNVRPAVLNHHLAARGVEVEAGAKTGTARSGGVLYSLIAKGLLGRAALAAISSVIRREPEFTGAITGGAAAAGGAGFAGTNNLIQHFNRAGTPPVTSEPASGSGENDGEDDSSIAVGLKTASKQVHWAPSPVWTDSDGPETGSSFSSTTSFSSGTTSSSSDTTSSSSDTTSSSSDTTSSSSDTSSSSSDSDTSSSSSDTGSSMSESTPLLPPSESTPSTPSTGIVSKLKSLVNTPAKASLSGLTVGGLASAAGFGIVKALGRRDLDADTVHLLGRDFEDLFARSSGIDELD